VRIGGGAITAGGGWSGGGSGAAGGSGLTVAGAGRSIAGSALSSLAGWSRIATSVAAVPITAAETTPMIQSGGPRRGRSRAAGGGGKA
jgi:hypothetical protein